MQNVFNELFFWKYQGGGNDFILIADWSASFSLWDKEYIIRLCHRHYGIGADGLIVLRKSTHAHCYMYFFNSDGSSAGLCGNGTRCVAQFLVDEGLLQEGQCLIEGSRGIIVLYQEAQEFVSVLPVYSLKKYNSSLFVVDIGALHTVQFFWGGRIENFFSYAQKVRALPELPKEGVNVTGVWPTAQGEAFELSVFERGVGEETLSCATGIGAAALVLFVYGLGSSFCMYTKGGEWFHAKVDGEDIHVRGPARKVFQGRLSLQGGIKGFHGKEQQRMKA